MSRNPALRSDRLRLVGFVLLALVGGAGLALVGGGPRVPATLPTTSQMGTLLAGQQVPLEVVGAVAIDLAWLLWLWLAASLGLELLLVAAEALAHGAAWVRMLRRVADRVSLPLARRAVTAAFAVQVLARAVPAAAAEPLPAPAVVVAAPVTAAQAEAVSAASTTSYQVRSGDTLWTIAELAYGSGTHYRRIVDANLGRRMPDGTRFPATGVIRPGWVLDVPEPTTWVAGSDDERWYTVRGGDTLSSIAGAVLGDRERWRELFELNRGQARLAAPDRALSEPDLIWPGLRLRLPSAADLAETEPMSEPDDNQVDVADEPEPEPVTPQVTTAAVPPPVEAPQPPVIMSLAAPPVEVPPLVRQLHPLPPVTFEPEPPSLASDESDTVEAPTSDSPAPAPLALGGLGVAAAAGVALGVHRLRRLRRLPRAPESDIVVEGGYAEAQLTQEFARHLQGGTFDPLQALVARFQAFIDEYQLANVQLVATRHGRSSTTLCVAAGLSEQALLVDLAPVLAERLQADIESWISADQDVHLRFDGVRGARLLPAADAQQRPSPTLVPLGLLYDHQVFSASWAALGHVLVASLAGHGGERILTCLLATLTARHSPDALRVWLVAQPRTVPAPLAQLPHLELHIDPRADGGLDELCARLEAELAVRAARPNEQPELVVVLGELAELGDRATYLQLLTARATASGVRLLAATGEPLVAAQSPLLAHFTSRLVLQMDAEETSVALLGVADAAYLGGGGRLLLRLDGREPVELYGYQVQVEHLERLVRVMRSAYVTGSNQEPFREAPAPVQSETNEAHSPDDEQDERPPEPQVQVTTESPAVVAPQPAGAQPIQILCFGAPRVLCAGQQVWPRGAGGDAKPWEFLLFLACQPREGVMRQDVVDALWPDDSGAHDPTHRFRQLRYRLRTAFSKVPGAPAGDGVCLERGGALYLDPKVIYSDAHEFLDLVRLARAFPGPSSLARLERARELYAADLFDARESRRYPWVDERDESGVTLREHFRRNLIQANVLLAQLHQQEGRLDTAVELYREITRLEPGDEAHWIALFTLHAQRFDRPALLREDRRMRALLHELAASDDSSPFAASSEPSHEVVREFQRLLGTLDDQDVATAPAV